MYKIFEGIKLLKEAGFYQGIIVVIIFLIVLMIYYTILCITNCVTKIWEYRVEPYKYKKLCKLAERHLCWYRNRARELFEDKEYEKAIEYMNGSIKDLCEVIKNVSPESAKSISGKVRQDFDRSSSDTQQSYAEIKD